MVSISGLVLSTTVVILVGQWMYIVKNYEENEYSTYHWRKLLFRFHLFATLFLSFPLLVVLAGGRINVIIMSGILYLFIGVPIISHHVNRDRAALANKSVEIHRQNYLLTLILNLVTFSFYAVRYMTIRHERTGKHPGQNIFHSYGRVLTHFYHTYAPSRDNPVTPTTEEGTTEMKSNSRAEATISGTEDRESGPMGGQGAQRIPETSGVQAGSKYIESLTYDKIKKGNTIGSGGNADVYRATTKDGEIELAIKEPRMSGTVQTETVEGILEEAETWDKLDDHEHIVDIIDYRIDPLPWIAMEYMDGGPLDDRAGQLDIDQALWTAIAVTKAVRHAHRRGIAHLDLKPENVLFQTVEDAWDVPKVADWGLSKQLLNHSKSVEGLSPHYAAPEQFDDDYGATDDITDIYQLGAVFYELFTGRPPFEGKPAKVMNDVLHEEPAPPSDIANVPSELDDILLTAMAKEKTDRYEDVLLLRNSLQDVHQ